MEAVIRGGGRVPEASGDKSPLCPAVLYVGEMPLYRARGRIDIKLVANIDQVLHRCGVNIVDSREVKNDRFKERKVRSILFRLPFARTWVVPGAVTGFAVGEGVGATGLFEEGINQVVGVMVGVRVVEALGQAIDKDTRERLFDLDVGVGTVGVIKGKEDRAYAVSVTAKGRLGFLQIVISDNRMNSDTAQKFAAGLCNTEQKYRCRYTDSAVNTNLNCGEDGNNDTNEEDQTVEG